MLKDLGKKALNGTESQAKSPRFRDDGDRLRDAGNWAQAATAYRRFLSENPRDFGIWIQCGNCLKEAGDYDSAYVAYRTALDLRDDDADAYLQLGHLLKLQGRRGEAAEAYARSFEIHPSRDARAELVALGRPLPSREDEVSVRQQQGTFFEIDDFLNYMKAHQTLSGIQRVQVAIADQILQSGARGDFGFVVRGTSSDTYFLIDSQDLHRIIEYVTGPRVDHDYLRRMIAAAEGAAVEVVPPSGSVYLVLGAFWGYGGVASRYNYLKAAGVRVGAYIYDVIPYSHPEFCDDRLVHDFVLSLADGLAVFDFILTISEFTASEVRRIIEANGLPWRPVRAVPLAHTLSLRPQKLSKQPHPLKDNLSFLADRTYVLYVSTIEGRKNHAYVVSIWRKLIQDGVDMPDLVFVGRKGWRVAGLMEMLEATNNLDDRLHILHDLPDTKLQALYENCLFTTFTSFVEGWGLPVGESLAYGKLCVCSRTSSIPEVGGEFVDYVDPLNVQDGLIVIRRLIADADYLQKRTEAIRSNFIPRSWAKVAADFLAALRACIQEAPTSRQLVSPLPPGKLLLPGTLSFGNKIPDTYFVSPARLLFSDGWFQPENFGIWMKGHRGSLSFPPELDDLNDTVIVYLGIVGSPGNALTVEISAEDSSQRPAGGNASRSEKHTKAIQLHTGLTHVKLETKRGRDGLVTIRFRVQGEIVRQPVDTREFALGLNMLAYCGRKDLPARVNIIEEMLL